MRVIVTGPNNSGKSAFAEKLAACLSTGPLVYIATMIPYGEDGMRRVEKHIEQRQEYGFLTIESPYSVSHLSLPPNATVLIEDVSNLLANAMFEKYRDAPGVLRDIVALGGRCENLIAVSIGGLNSADTGDAETRDYIDGLNYINTELQKWADKAILMINGEPDEIKCS